MPHVNERIKWLLFIFPKAKRVAKKILREDATGKFWILEPRNSNHRTRVISKKDEGVQFVAVEGEWGNFE